MTATGEAVNYETTVAELEAILVEQRKWLDAAEGCLASVEQAKNYITDVQESYRSTATAAHGVQEHLTGMNLDATTLGHVGTVGDAMPPSRVDTMLAHLEEVEQEAKVQRDNAATALAATEAALAHVVSEYGEEAAKVANNLSGDPTFLGSGGGTSAQPVGAGV